MSRRLGVQLDDELFVDDGGDFFAGRDVGDGGLEFVLVDFEPRGPAAGFGGVEVGLGEFAALLGVAGLDDFAGLAFVGGDVDLLAVDADVSVEDELAGGAAGRGEAHAVDDVVEA